MAITEDIGFPRLTPPGDRMPSGRKLFRREEELTDDQFDLLAAAWSEDALSGEALAELETIFCARPDRRNRAETFRKVRLRPAEERWPGMQSSLRIPGTLTVLRRTVIPALLAVAAMIVIIIYGPAGAKLKRINTLQPVAEMTVATGEIEASYPIIASRTTFSTTVNSTIRESEPENTEEPQVMTEEVRALPLTLAYSREMPESVAPAASMGLASMNIMQIQTPQAVQEEQNWILRSISHLASAVTGKDQKIDGFMIASGAITGINTLLGWDMELEQVSNRKGDAVALNFSSSLLSFTKPLNKSTP